MGPVPSAKLPCPALEPSPSILIAFVHIISALPGCPAEPLICVPSSVIKWLPEVGSNLSNAPAVINDKLETLDVPTANTLESSPSWVK